MPTRIELSRDQVVALKHEYNAHISDLRNGNPPGMIVAQVWEGFAVVQYMPAATAAPLVRAIDGKDPKVITPDEAAKRWPPR